MKVRCGFALLALMVAVSPLAAAPVFQFISQRNYVSGDGYSLRFNGRENRSYEQYNLQRSNEHYANTFEAQLPPAHLEQSSAIQTISLYGNGFQWIGDADSIMEYGSWYREAARSQCDLGFTLDLSEPTEFLVVWSALVSLSAENPDPNASGEATFSVHQFGDQGFVPILELKTEPSSGPYPDIEFRPLRLPAGRYEVNANSIAATYSDPADIGYGRVRVDAHAELTFLVVPEPATWLLAALAGVAMTMIWRSPRA